MFKDFNQYIADKRSVFNAMVNIVKHDCYQLARLEGGIGYRLIPDSRIGLESAKLLTSPDNSASRHELHLWLQTVKEGPKIFRPSQEQFEMMGHMTLNIDFSDYVQPFDTMMIELPENYTRNRIVRFPGNDGTYPKDHAPKGVIINHNKELRTLITAVFYSSGVSIKTAMAFREDQTIEDYLVTNCPNEKYDDTMECSEEELRIHYEVLRSALNYCLLLDEFGVKKVGPHNPNYFDRLQKYKLNAARSGDQDRIKRTANDIKFHPVVYAINQEVQLHKTVKSHSELPASGEGDRIMSPHHRRGHYRQQRFGPGLCNKRRRRIKPIFVNSHLFLGEMKDAKATYHSR